MDPGKAVDERVGHPVPKVVLCRIPREVLQRQYRQRPDFGLRHIPGAVSRHEVSGGKQADYDNPCQNQPAARPKSRSMAVVRFYRRLGLLLRLFRFRYLAQILSAALQPCIQLGSQGVNGATLVVQVAVDRHGLPLLPALNRRHIAAEIRRDFLPRIQPVFGRFLGRRRG